MIARGATADQSQAMVEIGGEGGAWLGWQDYRSAVAFDAVLDSLPCVISS